MNIVGNCIHNIFACIDKYNDKERNEMIDRIISQYHLKETLINKDSIATAWYNLRQYLAERFGQATNIYHERPFRMEQNGQTIVGSMDLVWQTKQGNIVIDFKTNPMGYKELTDKDSLHYAGRYGGQLNTYRKAIITGGETVIATIVYYPVAGLVIELE
jgi:ATP-dependent exoDNAse (exonuclease V) beta subunit